MKNVVGENIIFSNCVKYIKHCYYCVKEESEEAFRWFQSNTMIVNPEKCQVILIDKKRQSNDHTEIMLNGKHIKSDGSVTLLGIENDKQIKF